MTGRLYCGTSGYSYPTWKPDFYPAKLPAKQFLKYYATQFPAVESNYTYRSLPSASTTAQWIQNTPESFRFAVKAHQNLTHRSAATALEFAGLFFDALAPLLEAGKLGPILFQFPPSAQLNAKRLEDLFGTVPDGMHIAAEFRHASWFTDEIYRLLERHGAALCLAESERLETPPVLTANFVYARLRKSAYSPEALQQIQGQAAQFRAGGRDSYLFFMHQDDPSGTAYAQAILKAG